MQRLGSAGTNIGVEDAGVAVGVCAGEAHGRVGRAVAAAADAHLGAGRVELGAAHGHSELQRDDLRWASKYTRDELVRALNTYLMPDEIVAGDDGVRERHRIGLAVH